MYFMKLTQSYRIIYHNQEVSELKMRKMRVVTVINQKGGVGKTTTALYLAYALASRGKKVLAVDLESSRNMTMLLSDFKYKPKRTCLDAFIGLNLMSPDDERGCDISDAILTYKDLEEAGIVGKNGRRDGLRPNLDLLPGDLDLAESPWVGRFKDKDRNVIKDALELVNEDYDYCVIDTPPSLSIVTINAIVASDDIIIPSELEELSIEAIGQLMETIQASNPDVRIAGVLPTKCEMHKNSDKYGMMKIMEDVEALGLPLFKARIRYSSVVKQSRPLKRFLREYTPKSEVVSDYEYFVKEYMNGVKKLTKREET